MRYEVIFEKGNYSLIVRRNNLDEYAVVHGLNKEGGEWNYTVRYWNFGEYSSISKCEALALALDCFRTKTEEDYISRSRLEELATKFKDGLLEDDYCSAMEYFKGECEMSESEMKWFGIIETEEY